MGRHATWKSQTPLVKQRVGPASEAGLRAVAIPIAELIKTRLRRGYTSGRFVTSVSADAVQISEPIRSGSGREVSVGTDLISNLQWEVGGINLFTRRYERVEIWRPIAFNNRDRAAEAFARTFKRAMETGA